tara:strand:+ start:206 stop:385 length:180 start_codon:yes stop_codon:yes gene_type:complete
MSEMAKRLSNEKGSLKLRLAAIEEEWFKNNVVDTLSVVEFDRLTRRLEELKEEISQINS